MRDTSDMMEDALSEDTMMDCGGDVGSLEDLVDLARDITDRSPTIRDAAERLLTFLGMDEDDEDFLSSSDDEGVEVDVDELEDDDVETESTRFFRQLAISLAQELKYSPKQTPSSSRTVYQGRDALHAAETPQSNGYYGHDDGSLQQYDDAASIASFRRNDYLVRDHLKEWNAAGGRRFTDPGGFGEDRQESHARTYQSRNTANLAFSGYTSLDRRAKIGDLEAAQAGRSFERQEQDLGSWQAGWDACAAEALRYLVEDEGLPPHHPTVVAMKNHLDAQREKTLVQYVGYTDTKPHDTSVFLD